MNAIDATSMPQWDGSYGAGFKEPDVWSDSHQRPVLSFVRSDICDVYPAPLYWHPPTPVNELGSSASSTIDDGTSSSSRAPMHPVGAEYPFPEAVPRPQGSLSHCAGPYTAQNGASSYPSPTNSAPLWPTLNESAHGIALQDIQNHPDSCPDDLYPSEPAASYTYPYPTQIDEPHDIAVPALSEDDGASDTTPDDAPLSPHTGIASPSPPVARATPGLRKASPTTPPARIRKRAPQNRRASRRAGRDNTRSSTAASAGAARGRLRCEHCAGIWQSPVALQRHVAAEHTRPFTCALALYGCRATFGAKNEWKRHVASQHLRLGFWRCDMDRCLPELQQRDSASTTSSAAGSTTPDMKRESDEEEEVELIFNDFNRKDLFVQHVRRMHGPAKTASAAAHSAFKKPLDEAAHRCFILLRGLPPVSRCGFCAANGQQVVFKGQGSWEARMEHVGRHLESGDGRTGQWIEDEDLKRYLVDEGLVEGSEGTGWRLVGQ